MLEWLKDEFKNDWFDTMVAICVCLMMSSCTLRSIYCDWAGCKTSNIEIK